MTKTPQQDLSDAVQMLPYEVFDSGIISVMGGVMPIAGINIVEGQIEQVIAELQGDDLSQDIVFRHCLQAAPSHSLESMGWVPGIQDVEDPWHPLITEHLLVLPQSDVLDGGNSIHRQYLWDPVPEMDDSAALTYTIYEIKTEVVLWGEVLKVSYIGMTGQEVKQRMLAHWSLKAPGNAPLSHSLNSGTDYELIIIDTKSDKEEAKAIEKKVIVAREWVFNKKHTSESGNSVYDQYLLEHDEVTPWKKPH